MSEAQKHAKASKTGIVAMVGRGGDVRAYVTPREGALETVSLHVDPKATVYTDEWAGYRKLHTKADARCSQNSLGARPKRSSDISVSRSIRPQGGVLWRRARDTKAMDQAAGKRGLELRPWK
jgi:hypothetical protein